MSKKTKKQNLKSELPEIKIEGDIDNNDDNSFENVEKKEVKKEIPQVGETLPSGHKVITDSELKEIYNKKFKEMEDKERLLRAEVEKVEQLKNAMEAKSSKLTKDIDDFKKIQSIYDDIQKAKVRSLYSDKSKKIDVFKMVTNKAGVTSKEIIKIQNTEFELERYISLGYTVDVR